MLLSAVGHTEEEPLALAIGVGVWSHIAVVRHCVVVAVGCVDISSVEIATLKVGVEVMHS